MREITIESDSKLIIDVVKGMNKINWAIDGTIRDIHRLTLNFKSSEIGHVYKDGNKVADALAVLGLQIGGLRCWRRMESLPNNIQLLLDGEHLN